MGRIIVVLVLALLLAAATPVLAGHGGGELLGARAARAQTQ
ncbi:MAG TPA: hypothetical protein VFT63_03755 [bacterium]|nr:hypothetical protein [bacterium]